MNASEPWTKSTHVIPASHPRGYPRGVRDSQVSRLKLHVSQYMPQTPHEPGVTLILQHGMAPGDNAACLEPFLSDLLGLNVPVRSVWAMDAVSCGRSFLLNRDEIGDEHHWFDSARDVTQLVSYFQLKPPIIGFGQSWGVATLLAAASWNPQLFHGVVCSEPVIRSVYHEWKERGSVPGEDMKMTMSAALYRRPRVLKEAPRLDGYESRVRQKILENDYVERDGKLELITPPSQTVAYFVRPDPPIAGIGEDARYATRTEEMKFPAGFWNSWAVELEDAMKNVACKALFLWATKKPTALPRSGQEFVMRNLGSNIGVSQVEEVKVEGGHSLPLFVPMRTAQAVAPWVRKVWHEWQEEQKRRLKEPPIDPERLPREFEERLLGKTKL